jgi:hypothetical protein
MSKTPPLDRQEEDRVDDYYRQASALDQGRPSEAVRRAIVAHAAKLATGRTTQRPVRSWWNPAFFGSLAAAAIVGLLVSPQFFRIGEPVADSTAKAEAKTANDANIGVAKKSVGLDHDLARNEVPAAPSARARRSTDASGPSATAEHADINAPDADGRTALMLAVLRDQADAVADLLMRGADPNVADADGKTPLQVAVANHQPAIIAALTRAGAR